MLLLYMLFDLVALDFGQPWVSNSLSHKTAVEHVVYQ